MRNFLMAASLLASCAAGATQAHAATRVWQGVSQTVINNDDSSDDYGQSEQYTVRFEIDSTAPIVFNNYPTTPEPGFGIEYYDWAYYSNITSFSITGPRFNVSVGDDNAFTRVSMLRFERLRGGNTGFSAFAGSGDFSEGYRFNLNYYVRNGFPNTAIPQTLDIADAVDNGFVLSYNRAIEDSEEFDAREVLNFRFASGGFLPSAETPAVPEPATWAMMIAGFGIVGASLRRRRTTVTFAVA